MQAEGVIPGDRVKGTRDEVGLLSEGAQTLQEGDMK